MSWPCIAVPQGSALDPPNYPCQLQYASPAQPYSATNLAVETVIPSPPAVIPSLESSLTHHKCQVLDGCLSTFVGRFGQQMALSMQEQVETQNPSLWGNYKCWVAPEGCLGPNIKVHGDNGHQSPAQCHTSWPLHNTTNNVVLCTWVEREAQLWANHAPIFTYHEQIFRLLLKISMCENHYVRDLFLFCWQFFGAAHHLLAAH